MIFQMNQLHDNGGPFLNFLNIPHVRSILLCRQLVLYALMELGTTLICFDSNTCMSISI